MEGRATKKGRLKQPRYIRDLGGSLALMLVKCMGDGMGSRDQPLRIVAHPSTRQKGRFW